MSYARLALLPHPVYPDQFSIRCVRDGDQQPFELNGSAGLLFVDHAIQVVGGRCQTLHYSYRLQHGKDRHDWIIRWEYLRNLPSPDYPYPLGHLHAKADLTDPSARALAAKAAPKLHLATGRVALELVLWHLISDWAVTPIADDWKAILRDSLTGFEDRRTAP